MEIIKTSIEGLVIIQPRVFEDERGYFMETYKEAFIKENFPDIDFIQDNESKSTFGVLRGLHFQKPPFGETKLIRCISGSVIDFALDLRKDSKTFLKVFKVELSAENKKQLLVPQGFAHGYSVLSQTAEVLYKCDNFYNKQSEGGILYNDATLNIDWQIPLEKVIVSEKDLILPTFENCVTNFMYNP